MAIVAKRRGRPRTCGPRVFCAVRFPREMHAQLKLLAEASHRPLANWVLQCCAEALAVEQKKNAA